MLIKAPNAQVRLATTSGHVLWLGPNEERELAGDLLQLAYENGCTRVESAPVAEAPAPAPFPSPDERVEQVEAAIRELMERGDSTAFTSAGMPRVREVAVILGDETTKAEIETVFAAMST
jgi:hypothetical protein